VTMWSIHPPFGIDPDVISRNSQTRRKGEAAATLPYREGPFLQASPCRTERSLRAQGWPLRWTPPRRSSGGFNSLHMPEFTD
jgi:hypothetical protein